MAVETLPGLTATLPAAPDAGDGTQAARPAPDRRTVLARSIVAILSRTIPGASGLTVSLDGDAALPPPADAVPGGRRAHVRIHGPDAVGRLVLKPTDDGFAEGFLRGDLDIEGDVATAIEAARGIDYRRLTPVDVRRLARYAFQLTRGQARATPPLRLARLSGRRHSRARDLEAVRFHYDVGEDFFRLWLDRRLTYSCAYFEHGDHHVSGLDAAQEAKLDLICRKLELRRGQRLLDIGCGWGSLTLFAAERYGVEAIGVTLSDRQATEANRRARLFGLDSRARAEVRDYRDLAELGPFDAVASVGMFEHVGAANLRAYFAAAWNALVPGGLFLNHGIATNERGRPRVGLPRRRGFNDRYVFPDGELVPVERAVAIARDEAGFDLLDVQLLRPHYALTLQAWVERLEAHWDEAVLAAGEEVARTWRLYMSGARVGFERGEIDVAQLLLARPMPDGMPASRPLRPWW